MKGFFFEKRPNGANWLFYPTVHCAMYLGRRHVIIYTEIHLFYLSFNLFLSFESFSSMKSLLILLQVASRAKIIAAIVLMGKVHQNNFSLKIRQTKERFFNSKIIFLKFFLFYCFEKVHFWAALKGDGSKWITFYEGRLNSKEYMKLVFLKIFQCF